MKLLTAVIALVLLLMLGLTPIQSQQVIVTSPPLAEANVNEWIYKVEWNTQGTVLAVATGNGVYLYDRDLTPITAVNVNTVAYGLSWDATGTFLAITQANDIQIWAWNESAQTLTLLRILNGDNIQGTVLWNHFGTQLVSIELDVTEDGIVGRIHLWSSQTWQSERYVDLILYVDPFDLELFSPGTNFDVTPLANRMSWNPHNAHELLTTGRQLIFDEQSGEYRVANNESAYFVIDTTTSVVARAFPTNVYNAAAVSYNPQTPVFAGGSNSTPIQVRDNLTGDSLYGFGGYTGASSLFSWSPNGRYLDVGGQILDSETRRDIGMFQNNDGGVIANIWHPSGNFVTYGFTSGVIATYPGTAFPGFQ